MAVAGRGVLHADALVRAADRRDPRPARRGRWTSSASDIDIIWSKGNRSRRLPVTPDVMRVLDACDTQSRARFPGRAHFFVSGTGSQVSPGNGRKVFARIWDQAGLARPPAAGSPCPTHFRHHFAYACIERWRIQGKDVHAMLPYLSAYMGHASFDSTYYYIHTSPDFLDAYDGITTAKPGHCCPRSGSDETRPGNRQPGPVRLRP